MSLPAALSGLRVTEIGDHIAGAFASRLLGDHGADVVKIAPLESATGSPLFQYLNWNKRLVMVREGQDRDELIAGADVVIAAGLHDVNRLRAINPRAVLTLISAFGQNGPYRDFETTDLVLQAMSGVMAISGSRDREPLRHGLRTSYYLAGLNAAYVTLAGVLALGRTGEGITIDLAIRDCLSSELVMNHALHVFTGVVQGAPGEAGDPLDGHPLATSDGFVSLQTSARQTVADLAELLDIEALAEPRFATAERRSASGTELRALLAGRLSQERAQDVFLRASRRGLLSGAVQNATDLLACPQLEERGVYTRLSGATELRMPAVLAQLSRTPSAVRRPSPTVLTSAADVIAERRRRPIKPRSRLQPDPIKPLAGLRVLDLSVIFAAPYMGALLADLGAEVIKVEAPGRIDQTRTDWGGYFDNLPGSEPWNRSGTFQVLNRGKRSFAVDLSTAEGQALFASLVVGSDIVLENFSRAVPPKLGVTAEQLSTINPRLVMLSNTGYGATGPWASFKAQGTTLEATMGLMGVTGYENGPPARAGQSVPDFIACWAGLVALFAALIHRDKTGEGQYIDLGMYQLGPSVIPEALIAAQTGDPLPGLGAAVDLDAVRSELVQARDGWLAVAVQDEARRHALTELLAGQELGEWAAERQAWPATQELQALGIAAGPVLDAASLLHDPQLSGRGFFEDTMIDQLGERRVLIGRPYRWDAAGCQVGITGCAPSFGADNDYVLRELLGLDDDRIQRLRADGIIVDHPVNPPAASPLSLAGRRTVRVGPKELQAA